MHLRQWRSFGSTNCDVGELERASEAIVSCMQRGGGISLGTGGMEMEWKGNITLYIPGMHMLFGGSAARCGPFDHSHFQVAMTIRASAG